VLSAVGVVTSLWNCVDLCSCPESMLLCVTGSACVSLGVEPHWRRCRLADGGPANILGVKKATNDFLC
jgi:hypothetical protein